MELAINKDHVKQLDGGRMWRRGGHAHQTMWDSDCGNYRIVELDNTKDEFLLISFIHDADDGDVWRKKFATMAEAMEHAEVI